MKGYGNLSIVATEWPPMGVEMDQSGGWLARTARRIGAMVGSKVGPAETLLPPSKSAPSRHENLHREANTALRNHAETNASGLFVAGGYSLPTMDQTISTDERRNRAAKTAEAAVHLNSQKRPASLWIGSRETLMAGGTSFAADMIYYGVPLRYDPRHDQSRIDPSLSVDPRGDRLGATLDYWPSYQGLDPRARATYLAWLDGGRSDRSIPIGYVFVFFYGLEQRLLLDDAREDAPAIFAETRRLLELHGENYSFRAYASKLLALSAVYEGEDDVPPTAASAEKYELEIPLDVRVRLGRKLRDGKPFNADDALHWVLSLPDVYLRTPGQRCFAELRALWSVRFAERYSEGLTIRRPKATLRHEYRAASGKFSVSLNIGELPDVAGTQSVLGPLRTLLDLCMEDLSQYSRLLGREPDARGLLRADLLLPAELRAESVALAACRETLQQIVSEHGYGVIGAGELARVLGIEPEVGAEKLAATTIRQIGTALDALHYGCEPDRRYGTGSALRSDAPVAVFSSQSGGPVDHDRPAYAAARTLVEIAMLAAVSDGEVVDTELETVEKRLRALPELVEHEIVRLMAFGRALAADPPKARLVLKRLAEVPATQRVAIASSAIEAVLADGTVRPDEVKFLEALHAALGLPVAGLYASLHRGADDPGPVVVLTGETDKVVPIPSDQATGAMPIDAARLEKIREETTRVSALLATIFIEEEPETTPKPTQVRAVGAIDGLDGPHSELLLKLCAGPVDRSEFDAVASALRLMPEGAIEAINEWGFDRFGEAVIDDDDGVRVSLHLADQIESLGAAV